MLGKAFQIGENVTGEGQVIAIHDVRLVCCLHVFVGRHPRAFPEHLAEPAVIEKSAAPGHFLQRIFILIDQLAGLVNFQTFDVETRRFPRKFLEKFEDIGPVKPEIVRNALYRQFGTKVHLDVIDDGIKVLLRPIGKHGVFLWKGFDQPFDEQVQSAEREKLRIVRLIHSFINSLDQRRALRPRDIDHRIFRTD